MRYIWAQSHHYLGTGMRRRLSFPLVSALRSFDRKTSGPKNVDRFVATSRAVSQRIQDHYGRASTVLAPPGGNFPPIEHIADREEQAGKPVLTTNQVVIWAVMAALDISTPLSGLGQLLEELPARSA